MEPKKDSKEILQRQGISKYLRGYLKAIWLAQFDLHKASWAQLFSTKHNRNHEGAQLTILSKKSLV